MPLSIFGIEKGSIAIYKIMRVRTQKQRPLPPRQRSLLYYCDCDNRFNQSVTKGNKAMLRARLMAVLSSR